MIVRVTIAALIGAAALLGPIQALADAPPQPGSCSTGVTTAAAVCSPGESTFADPKPWLRQSDGSAVDSLTAHTPRVSSGGGAAGSVYRVHANGTVTVAQRAEQSSVGQDNTADWLTRVVTAVSDIGGAW